MCRYSITGYSTRQKQYGCKAENLKNRRRAASGLPITETFLPKRHEAVPVSGALRGLYYEAVLGINNLVAQSLSAARLCRVLSVA
jgi:hypothetical protein